MSTPSPSGPPEAQLLHLRNSQQLVLTPPHGNRWVSIQVIDGFIRLSAHHGDQIPETTLALMSPMEGGGFLHPKSCNLQLEALSESTLTIQYGQESISQQDDFLTEWLMALHVVRHPVKADERLFNLLKLLVYRLGRRTREGCTLSFLLSHSRLAEIIGTTRSTVSRSMGKLRENGSISIEESKGLLTIKD